MPIAPASRRPTRTRRALARLPLAVTLAAGSPGLPTRAAPQAPAPALPADLTAQRLGRGVNVLGYDGIWESGINAPFRLHYFKMLRDAGFRHVRINIHDFRFMNAQNWIETAMLARLDRVLRATIAAGLVPVVDEHDFDVCQVQVESCAVKHKSFWI